MLLEACAGLAATKAPAAQSASSTPITLPVVLVPRAVRTRISAGRDGRRRKRPAAGSRPPRFRALADANVCSDAEVAASAAGADDVTAAEARPRDGGLRGEASGGADLGEDRGDARKAVRRREGPRDDRHLVARGAATRDATYEDGAAAPHGAGRDRERDRRAARPAADVEAARDDESHPDAGPSGRRDRTEDEPPAAAVGHAAPGDAAACWGRAGVQLVARQLERLVIRSP